MPANSEGEAAKAFGKSAVCLLDVQRSMEYAAGGTAGTATEGNSGEDAQAVQAVTAAASEAAHAAWPIATGVFATGECSMDDAFLTELDRLFQDDVRPQHCACRLPCIAPRLLLAEQPPYRKARVLIM